MKKWEKYSKEELQKMANEVYSIASLCEKIGYSPTGGSGPYIIKEMIQTLNLDVSHFKGQGWNKENFDYSRFKKGNAIPIRNALPAIAALRGRNCECCGNEYWNGEKIPLEVHHIDGDHSNNDLSNLQILCPNCHAQTSNYKHRNSRSADKVDDETLVKALQEKPNVRQALISLGLSGSGGNYARAYNLANQYNIEHIVNRK